MSEHEFFLPVHDFSHLTDEERSVVDHAAFQRLGKIYQLGQAYLIYRGATHKRLEHSLGVLHVAGQMVRSINENHNRKRARIAELKQQGREPESLPDAWPLDDDLTPAEAAFIRLGALLHDIGHLPFGHTLEDEVGLISNKHDENHRLELILNKTNWADGGSGQSLGSLIDMKYAKYIEESGRLKASDILKRIISKKEDLDGGLLVGKQPLRINVYKEMVSDTICADLLDYIYRDWHHIGKPRRIDSRIFQYMEIRRPPKVSTEAAAKSARFVISLGNRPRLKTDAITSILTLLESRYELWENVLFHRVKLGAAAMLERAVKEMQAGGINLNNLEEKLLDFSDEQVLRYFSDLVHDKDKAIINAQLPISSLLQRRIYKIVEARSRDELAPEVAWQIERIYADEKKGHERRLIVAHILERDFDLRPGSLAIYCTPSMRAKVPKVHIHINGFVERFDKWEEETSDMLSGGHIRAQMRRFQRLWRIFFFLEESEYRRLETEDKLHWLREAIERLALGQVPHGEYLQDVSRTMSRTLKLGRNDGDSNRYPTGAPSLSSWPSE